MTAYPKVRQLEFHPVNYQGKNQWLIRDIHQISPGFILPPAEAELVNRLYIECNGSRSVAELYTAVNANIQGTLPAGIIEEILDVLDEHYLLENERFDAQMKTILQAYRQAPYRKMTLADQVYPAEKDALAAQFKKYGAEDSAQAISQWDGWQGRGIISPHIDYQRGGNIYASVWARAQDAVKACDLVLMFATDHKGGLGSLTLTKQPYQTPYGLLPTDTALVDKLAAAIGEDDAYRLELNHRHEHSVELSAVWLHHACPENPPPMVPILIGSFHHYVMGGSHPSKDPKMNQFLETLKAETVGKKVLCVASVDLAHVGPEFGDSYIMDQTKREALVETDKSLMGAISEGNAGRFYTEIADIQDSNKVCGFSPVYLMLQYMNAEKNTSGHPIGYQHCSADANDHSLVSICGMLLD